MSRIFFAGTCFLLIACVILGGGTDVGMLTTTILELFSLVLLGALLIQRLKSRSPLKWIYVIFWALPALYCLFQIVPLPPNLWSSLPGRAILVNTYTVLSEPLPWAPISMLPRVTRLTAFTLLPAATMFVLALYMTSNRRSILISTMLAVILLSDTLGLLQFSQGTSSPLRFYFETNYQRPVGFFANSNHFAALLYSATVFGLGALAILIHPAHSGTVEHSPLLNNMITKTAAAMITICFISSEILTGSRMGSALSIVAIMLSIASALLMSRQDKSDKSGWVYSLVGITAVIIAFIFGFEQLYARFGIDEGNGSRWIFSTTTVKAALNYLPFGSGIGSFDHIYELYETRDTMLPTYVNHAHNDFAELFLETGVFGMLWVAAFVVWWARQSLLLWRESASLQFGHEQDWIWARAGSIVIGLLMCHSLVDYPLRTVTMSAIFGLCCALMLPSLVEDKPARPRHIPGKKKSRPKSSAPLPIGLGKTADPAAQKPKAPEPVHWPDAWKE